MNESKAARYQRRHRRGVVTSWVAATGALGLLALTPAGPWLYRLAIGATAALPVPVRELGSAVAFLTSVSLICMAAALLAMFRHGRSDREGVRPDAGSGPWKVILLGGALLVPVVVASGLVVIGSARLAGGAWWLIATAVFAAALAAVQRAGPGLLGVGGSVRSLSHPGLAGRVEALAARAGVPVMAVAELRDAEASSTVAMVAGTGRRRQVLVAADVVADWPEDEVMALVAHELAHLAHGDLVRSFALDVAILGVGLFVSDAVLGVAGATLGVGAADAPAAAPLIALASLGVWLVATPLRHAQSRRHERRADAFALRLTGNADAFATALRRASTRRLVDDRPGRIARWLFHRHPPIAERLAAAERFLQDAASPDPRTQRPPSTIRVP